MSVTQSINTLRDWVASKVATISSVKTFKFGYPYDINAVMRSNNYPLFLMVPPDFQRDNYTPNSNSPNRRIYDLDFWLYDNVLQSEYEDIEETYGALETKMFACIDAIFSELTLLSPAKNLQVIFYPDVGNDKVRAMQVMIKGYFNLCY